MSEAARLEEQSHGCFRNGAFEADFPRVGGPRSVLCLAVNVPDHFPGAKVHRLLSPLPNVISVELRDAYDSLGLTRTAYLAAFRTVEVLPWEVPLFAPDGSPLPPPQHV